MRRLLFAGAMLYGLIALLAYASQGSGFERTEFGNTSLNQEVKRPLFPITFQEGAVQWDDNSVALALFDGSFYQSELSGESAWTMVGRGAKSTLGLSLAALLTAAALALVSSLSKAGKRLLNQVAFALESLPMIVVGAFVLVAFSGISLVSGWEARVLFVAALMGKYWAGLHVFLISPATTIQEAPYLMTAKSKGLSTRSIVLRHSLPNLTVKLLPVLASGLPSLLSGAIILEEVLFQPGLGSVLVQAVLNHDLGVLCALLWLSGALSILGLMLPKAVNDFRGAKA